MTFGESGEGGGAVTQGTEGGQQGEQQGAGAPPAEGGQQQGAPDLSRLAASMDNFMADVGRRFDGLEQRITPAQAAAEQQQGEQGFDIAALLEGLPDEAFEDAEAGQQRELTPEGYLELMQQMARQEADRVRSEAAEAQRAEYRDSRATEIEQQYPDLSDRQSPFHQDKVFAEAQRAANAMGQPALAGEPDFFETVYFSMKARAAAAAEVGAQHVDPGVRLEQPGGGGGPVQSDDGRTAQQGIVEAARGSRFRLGS
jgi:hypothetical protein